MPISAKALRMRQWFDQKMVERWEAEAKAEAEKLRPRSAAEQIYPHLASSARAEPTKER